jgi:hypothetical protein
VVKTKNPVNLHGPMSSLLQNRSPFMPARFFYCGFRVELSNVGFEARSVQCSKTEVLEFMVFRFDLELLNPAGFIRGGG